MVDHIPVVGDLLTAWTALFEAQGQEVPPLGLPEQQRIKGKRPVMKRSAEAKGLYPVEVRLFHAYPEEWGAMQLFLTGTIFLPSRCGQRPNGRG